MVDQPNIFVDCFADYVTIVVKDAHDDVVFIFPANNISEVTQTNIAEVNVYVSSSLDEEILYVFVCEDDSDSSALGELLNRLIQHTGGTSAQFNDRPYDDLFVEHLFTLLETRLQQRVRRTPLMPSDSGVVSGFL